MNLPPDAFLHPWVLTHCENSKIVYVKNAPSFIESFWRYDQQEIRDEYGWKFSSVETHKKLRLKAKSGAEINQIYWQDFARNLASYSMISFWRAAEIFNASITLLNSRNYLPSAVLARSLLELTAQYKSNAIFLSCNLKQVLWKLGSNLDHVLESPDFEEFSLKAIWGTRQGEPEEYLKQQNVLTIIQKIANHPDTKILLDTYEYLCEIAHPNVVGNTRFFSHIEHAYNDGCELRVLNRYTDSNETSRIADATLWVLAWSALEIKNGFELIDNNLTALVDAVNS